MKICDLSEGIQFQELVKEVKRIISDLIEELIEHLGNAPIFLPRCMLHDNS